MLESLNEFWYRIRARFRRDELDAELANELRTHAEFLEDEARATGASPDEARRAASAALAAQARHFVASVVREGMVVVVVGVVLGMVLSWYASNAIAALLFQSSARDTMPYVYAAVVLGVVALAASIVPAWRATRVNPAIALRAE